MLTVNAAQSQENILECKFQLNLTYECHNEGSSLTGSDITGVSGNHNPNYKNSDVKTLIIQDPKNLTKIPKNLGEFFPNLLNLKVLKANLSLINKVDLKSMPKLQNLTLEDTNIQELPANLFEFTPDITEIITQNSPIEYVNAETFSGLKKLKVLKLKINCAEIDAKKINSRKLKNLIIEITSKCTELDKFFCFYETNQKTQRYMCRVKYFKYYKSEFPKQSVIGK